MRLSGRLDRLEREMISDSAPLIPQTVDEALDYLKHSRYSFAPGLAAMLQQSRDEYALAVVGGILGSPDPEATHESIVRIYGNLNG